MQKSIIAISLLFGFSAIADTTIDPAHPYAYGANTGWIRFEQTYGQPKIDLMTGAMSGYAYAANVGWINLETMQVASIAPGPDSDSDGLPDAWEYAHTNNLATLSGPGDLDADGVSDVDEYIADTDPMDGNDQLRITAFATDNTTNTVTWNAQPTRMYTLEHTPALDTNWSQALAPLVPSAAGDVTKTVDGTTNRFYRVIIELPLN